MRVLFTILALTVFQVSFSQNSFVYKRNPFGVLEVFQSQGGLPTGAPLYKIRKNIWGYLEVESLNAAANPYTRRPDYSSYITQGYNLPTKQIFETLEALNKRSEYNYITSNKFQAQYSRNSEIDKIIKDYQAMAQQSNNVATNYLNFYNSNISFPKELRNGWYDVVGITKQDGIPEAGIKEGLSYNTGICKVVNNKIVEYYKDCQTSDVKDGNVFEKINFDLVSPIKDCKSTYRNSFGFYYSLYFLDNILDSSKQTENPEFSFYSIYTSNNFKQQTLPLIINIFKNTLITKEFYNDKNDPPYLVVTGKPNPINNDCSNSLLTIAFRKPKSTSDNFSIGILSADFKSWIINNIPYTPSHCQSTILNE